MSLGRMVLFAVTVAAMAAPGCTEKNACEVTAHCLADTLCADGVCVETDNTDCEPTSDGADGCDAYHVCAEVSGGGSERLTFRCVEAPSCTGGCNELDIDAPGGVCNDGLWDEKNDGLCMVGRCQGSSDCPVGETCLFPPGADLGFCTSGSVGDLCLSNVDCFFEDCRSRLEGGFGVCGGPSTNPDPDMAPDPDPEPDGNGNECAATGGVCTDGFCSDLGLSLAFEECADPFQACCK